MRVLLDTHSFLWFINGDQKLSSRARALIADAGNRDPFDRLIVAQAMTRGVPLLSRDSLLEQYAIQRLW